MLNTQIVQHKAQRKDMTEEQYHALSAKIDRLLATHAPIIIGARNIAVRMGCSRETIYRWTRKLSFPAAPLPNGRLAVSQHMIDQWLLARRATRVNGRPMRSR